MILVTVLGEVRIKNSATDVSKIWLISMTFSALLKGEELGGFFRWIITPLYTTKCALSLTLSFAFDFSFFFGQTSHISILFFSSAETLTDWPAKNVRSALVQTPPNSL